MAILKGFHQFSPNVEFLSSSYFFIIIFTRFVVAIKRPQRKFTAVSRSDKKRAGTAMICFASCRAAATKWRWRFKRFSKLSMSVGICVIHDQFKNYFEKLPVALQRSEVTAICGFALERSHYSHRAL